MMRKGHEEVAHTHKMICMIKVGKSMGDEVALYDENTWEKSKGNGDGKHIRSNWICFQQLSIMTQVTSHQSLFLK